MLSFCLVTYNFNTKKKIKSHYFDDVNFIVNGRYSLFENLHSRENHFILYVAVQSMHIKKQIKVLSITSEMI